MKSYEIFKVILPVISDGIGMTPIKKIIGDIGKMLQIDCFIQKRVIVGEECNQVIFTKLEVPLMDHGIVDHLKRIVVMRVIMVWIHGILITLVLILDIVTDQAAGQMGKLQVTMVVYG
jgi:hypothetical protein